MSMQDPIADMLTRIRNGQSSKQDKVRMPSSKIKAEIARVLKEEGYINDYSVDQDTNSGHKVLTVFLKYFSGQPVIERITRISKPGLRQYTPAVNHAVKGFGIYIMTTPKGVMTQKAAFAANVGGEIICEVA